MVRLSYGGSFNPIHHGHLLSARAAAETGGYDGVTLVPTGQPPHKPAPTDLAAPHHRAAMCRQAAQASGGFFTVDEIELARIGPSYTLDTAQELRRRDGQEVHWLIGADMLRILPQWHRAEELVKEVRFVVMARPGWAFDWQTLPEAFRGLERNVVRTPLIEISATEVRARVRAGKSVAFMCPQDVVDYIDEHGLYR
ncbi:MAG: nicotinate-nucleotide adenylyltransferase [Tepidisphaeraceae bacterium]